MKTRCYRIVSAYSAFNGQEYNLARVELAHTAWLQRLGRASEACAGHSRTLNLVRGRFPPEPFRLRTLNLLAARAVTDARLAEEGLKLLYPWLRLLRVALHAELLCDLACYAGRARQHHGTEALQSRAQRAFTRYSGSDADGSADDAAEEADLKTDAGLNIPVSTAP